VLSPIFGLTAVARNEIQLQPSLFPAKSSGRSPWEGSNPSAVCAQRDAAAGSAAAPLTQSVVYSTTRVDFRATRRDRL